MQPYRARMVHPLNNAEDILKLETSGLIVRGHLPSSTLGRSSTIRYIVDEFIQLEGETPLYSRGVISS